MPAAVISIGKKRPISCAPISTDGSRRCWPATESASIDCARLIRGTASIAKLVAPVWAIARIASPCGQRLQKPDQDAVGRSRPISSAVGGATLTTTSASYDAAGVVDHLRAGLLVLGVGDQRPGAGAALDDDLEPAIVAGQLAHDLGHERDATLALGRLLGDSDPHERAGGYRVCAATKPQPCRSARA